MDLVLKVVLFIQERLELKVVDIGLVSGVLIQLFLSAQQVLDSPSLIFDL